MLSRRGHHPRRYAIFNPIDQAFALGLSLGITGTIAIGSALRITESFRKAVAESKRRAFERAELRAFAKRYAQPVRQSEPFPNALPGTKSDAYWSCAFLNPDGSAKSLVDDVQPGRPR